VWIWSLLGTTLGLAFAWNWQKLKFSESTKNPQGSSCMDVWGSSEVYFSFWFNHQILPGWHLPPIRAVWMELWAHSVVLWWWSRTCWTSSRRRQTLTIFIAIYCWPTISTFGGISLCCCCILLKQINKILLVLCCCKWGLYCVDVGLCTLIHISCNILGTTWTESELPWMLYLVKNCPELLIYSAISNFNQAKIFRPSLLIVFFWIWNEFWVNFAQNIDGVTLLGVFGLIYCCCHIDG
jgi:hypothetical protein